MTLKLSSLVGVGSGGAVSSVVEHYLDTVGVTGSNPVSRTIFFSASLSQTILHSKQGYAANSCIPLVQPNPLSLSLPTMAA